MARVGDIVKIPDSELCYNVVEVHWDGYTLVHPDEWCRRQADHNVKIVVTAGDLVSMDGHSYRFLGPSPDNPMFSRLWDEQTAEVLTVVCHKVSPLTATVAATSTTTASTTTTTAATAAGATMSTITTKLQDHAPSSLLDAIGSGIVDGSSAAVMSALALKIVEQSDSLQFVFGFIPEKYQEHLAGATLATTILAVDFFGGLPDSIAWAKPLALTSIRGNASGLAGKVTMPLVTALFKAKKSLAADGIEIPHPVPDVAPRQKTM